MFRRLVASLTLVGFLAWQLALVPHAHAGLAGGEKQRHDARPHFHLGFGDGHAHRHGHDHEHSDNRLRPANVGSPLADHDATVIFLPDGSSTAAGDSGERAALASETASTNLPAGAWLTPPQAEPGAPFHPPNGARSVCKLFLKLRALRI